MNKDQFVETYRERIRVHFNFDMLRDEPAIAIRQGARPVREFLNYYVPRYAKRGVLNNQPIEEIIHDSDSSLVKLKDIISAPESWDLIAFQNVDELKKGLWPIPVAFDSESGKTLILDSNHTICTLLINGIDMDVPYIELHGKDLSSLGADLKLMSNE